MVEESSKQGNDSRMEDVMKVEDCRRASILDVHDGDTFTAKIELWFGIYVETKIRVAHIDAPEIGTPDGSNAREFLTTLLGPKIKHGLIVKILGQEKYGRTLAEVWTVWSSARDKVPVCVHEEMLKVGMAKPYEGGARKVSDNPFENVIEL